MLFDHRVCLVFYHLFQLLGLVLILGQLLHDHLLDWLVGLLNNLLVVVLRVVNVPELHCVHVHDLPEKAKLEEIIVHLAHIQSVALWEIT